MGGTVSQVDSHMALACQHWRYGGTLEKEQWPVPALLCDRRLPPHHPNSCPGARQFSSSLYGPGSFQAAAPVLKLRGIESCESLWGPLRGTAWDSEALSLTQLQSPLVFYSQKLWGFFLLALNSWAGRTGVGLGPLAAQGPFCSQDLSPFICHMWVLDQPVLQSLFILPVSMGLLKFPNCRTSIQLDFRRF